MPSRYVYVGGVGTPPVSKELIMFAYPFSETFKRDCIIFENFLAFCSYSVYYMLSRLCLCYENSFLINIQVYKNKLPVQ